ncbi:hypothetical protein D3C78_922440 [compost metagenome]
MNTWKILKKGAAVLNRHLQHLGYVLALVLHLQRLSVIALALAYLTRHIHIRQEMHFNLDDAVSTARFAASALHIEAKAAFLIAANLRFIRTRV